jgi:hypothetical protein
VLTQGRQFLSYQAGVAVVIDAVWVALFIVYLIGASNSPAR